MKKNGYVVRLLLDPTHQQRYYSSAELLDLVDVGLVWRPGHQQGGPLAIRNRPPTRMHWWWSHGIPVIGYPMNAYVDAARRAHYPTDLLNLTTEGDIVNALRETVSIAYIYEDDPGAAAAAAARPRGARRAAAGSRPRP